MDSADVQELLDSYNQRLTIDDLIEMQEQNIKYLRNGSHKTHPQAKKSRKNPSKIKTRLITFFHARGIIDKEFVPTGQIITDQYYLDVLKRLMARIHRIHPEYRCLLHDNALSHTSLAARRILAKNNVCVLNHPPYSPDLAPCDYSMF
ncbi:HTH_48 domain-containing protein [Trichonephila clavipes]|nr:HTH_48 domain-containing protein [Trichonephila clavipes]